MLVTQWQKQKKAIIQLLMIAGGWTAFFIVLVWLNQQFHLGATLKAVKIETWLGLTATGITYGYTQLMAVQKKRQDEGLKAQEVNQDIIRQNNAETVEAMRNLEDGLDSLTIRLNVIQSLEIQQSKTWELLADMKVKLVDLNQRQIQGDRIVAALEKIETLTLIIGQLRKDLDQQVSATTECRVLESLAALIEDVQKLKSCQPP